MKQNVNYIQHHKSVNLRMIELNLNSTHISLYNALFLIWNECGFDTELSINRNDVMKLSKIGSANTYTKCLKDLHELEFIDYKPSYNPLVGSKIMIYRFDKGSDNSTNKGSGKSSSKGSGNGSDNSTATLYKLLNKETIKLINSKTKEVADFLNKNLFEILKENDSKIIYPFDQKEFIEMWKKWKTYKKEQFSFTYKSTSTEQAALMALSKLANNPADANKVIMQSIENGWKGFFNLKNNNNGIGKDWREGAARLIEKKRREQGIVD